MALHMRALLARSHLSCFRQAAALCVSRRFACRVATPTAPEQPSAQPVAQPAEADQQPADVVPTGQDGTADMPPIGQLVNKYGYINNVRVTSNSNSKQLGGFLAMLLRERDVVVELCVVGAAAKHQAVRAIIQANKYLDGAYEACFQPQRFVVRDTTGGAKQQQEGAAEQQSSEAADQDAGEAGSSADLSPRRYGMKLYVRRVPSGPSGEQQEAKQPRRARELRATSQGSHVPLSDAIVAELAPNKDRPLSDCTITCVGIRSGSQALSALSMARRRLILEGKDTVVVPRFEHTERPRDGGGEPEVFTRTVLRLLEVPPRDGAVKALLREQRVDERRNKRRELMERRQPRSKVQTAVQTAVQEQPAAEQVALLQQQVAALAQSQLELVQLLKQKELERAQSQAQQA